MKTIFITSFHSLISRNILQTDVLKLLIKSGAYIYIFCPDYKLEYFKKEFARDSVETIGIKNIHPNKTEAIFKQLASSLLPTSTIYFNRRERFLETNEFYRIGFFYLFT
jgi:hypothetical protein